MKRASISAVVYWAWPAQNYRPRVSKMDCNSGILVAVLRKSIPFLFTLIAAVAGSLAVYPKSTQAPAGAGANQSAPQPPQPAPQAAPQTSPAASQTPEPQPVVPQRNTLSVVVLDPAHGGADQGARGSSGIAESDVVLSFARLVRISLEGQGLRVILTRQANENPSFDDRSKLANAQRGVIFITLHVSSTGQPGTVRIYSLPRSSAPAAASASPRGGLLRWDHAQSRFLDLSQRLAGLIQIQMAQRFRGSPEIPVTAAVRQLRTVAAPAVAIEVSSVSLPDRAPLDQMGPALADGVARAVAAFRIVYESGGK
jgi:N-acetylmuramoyl-L-alanine amidase